MSLCRSAMFMLSFPGVVLCQRANAPNSGSDVPNLGYKLVSDWLREKVPAPPVKRLPTAPTQALSEC